MQGRLSVTRTCLGYAALLNNTVVTNSIAENSGFGDGRGHFTNSTPNGTTKPGTNNYGKLF